MGTLQNSAPEMLLSMEYNYKVDIWSLGCLFYRIATGESAFGKRQSFCSEESLQYRPKHFDDVSEKNILKNIGFQIGYPLPMRKYVLKMVDECYSSTFKPNMNPLSELNIGTRNYNLITVSLYL